MEAKYGDVVDASGSLHAVVVRSEGVFVSPTTGILADAATPGAIAISPSTEGVAHMVTFPDGTLGVEVTEPNTKRLIARLPGGTIVSMQPTAARISVQRVEGGAEVENTMKTQVGVADLTLLDPLRRSVERLMNAPGNSVDVGGARVAMFTEYPAALGVRCFPYPVQSVAGGLQVNFTMVQAFALPPGTPGVVDERRTIALVGGEPLVMTPLAPAYCRSSIDAALRAPMRDAPPDLLEIWEREVPPILADFCSVLDAIGPVHSVWPARAVQGAWERLDRAAERGGLR